MTESTTTVNQAATPDALPQVIVDNSRLRITGDFIRFSLMNLNEVDLKLAGAEVV